MIAARLEGGPLSTTTFGDPFLMMPGWNPQHQGISRYPTFSGTFDVSEWTHIGGIIGLNPSGDASRGLVVFKWTSDPEGQHICGVQGFPVSSQIVSNAELRMLNRGRYVYMEYTAFSGSNGLTANLYGTNAGGAQPHLCGDTILIEEMNRSLAANATSTVYPCDYFAGRAKVFFEASATTARCTFYYDNLTNDSRRCDEIGPGRTEVIVPMGTWFAVIWNASQNSMTYTLAVTQL